MEHTEIKNQFLERLPDEVTSKLLPEYIDILDESIENIINGKTNINGKTPTTDNEIFISLGYNLLTGIQAFEGLKKAVDKILVDSKEKTIVNVNYRGKTYTYQN